MKKLIQLWFDSSIEGAAILKPVRSRRDKTTMFQYLLGNRRFAQLLAPPENLSETITESLLSFIDYNILTPQLQGVLQTGMPWQGHCYQKTHKRWVSLTIIRLSKRLVLNLRQATFPEDDTQKNSLLESNQLLQTVFNSSPVGLALLRPVYQDGHITDFHYLISNPRNALITGFSQEEMLTNSVLKLFPDLAANGMFTKLVEVATTGEAQYFQLQADLKTVLSWGDFSLLRVGNDVLLTVQDITRQKQTEEDLRQTNLTLEQRVANRTADVRQLSAIQQAIITHAGLGIIATDKQGIIKLVNPALETLTGYSADELVDKGTPSMLRQPTVNKQQIDQLRPFIDDPSLPDDEVVMAYVTKHKFLRRENLIQTKTGQLMTVLSTISLLYDEQDTVQGFINVVTDISALKTIEETLLKAQQRNKLALKAGKLGLWEWDLLTDKITLDDPFYAYYNLPKNCFEYLDEAIPLVHQDDLPYVSQAIQAIKQGQDTLNLNLRIYLPFTRTTHFLQIDGLLYQSPCGTVREMIGVVVDKTSERQAEYALKVSERRYRLLVDNLKEAVFQTDAAGLWIYLNPAWEEITGFSIQESIGTLFLNYVLPADRARNQQLFEPLITREKTYCRHEIRYIHKTGGYRWILVFAQITTDEAGEITGTTGTLTDITEQRQAEAALRESEQRFREIAENVDEIFWSRNLKAPWELYLNPTFEALTGLTVKDFEKDPEVMLRHIVAEDIPAAEQSFQSLEPMTVLKFRIIDSTGSIRWMNTRLFTILDEEGTPVRRVGVATDITSVIEKEQLLEESLEKERALNALKSQFIATASHQFRTPLTAILSSVDLIQYYTGLNSNSSGSSLVKKQADRIYHQIMSLEELIADTLMLSKLDEGKVQVDLKAADLVALANEIITFSFGNREDGRLVDLTVTGQPVSVQVDKKLMGHVLSNLLSNAFKFSSTNPRVQLHFTTQSVTIAVHDEGIGIPSKDLPYLFGKFFRASNAHQINGTGLGLAICQEYVRLQKGVIDVDSQEGAGTTFTISLALGQRNT
ncbi:sensor histidine kinase [Spirosoma fluviale]|uniref:histidine kinase n=1 Tax=Spirosoma fluviale TaxID=1597977 RepID=A0A286GBL7_9BACT|nr:sensor histidine kinase [Spirosoma fluviale]SOD92925.1 PAS domain S-box-containing protein [Spirosoma fluviale]